MKKFVFFVVLLVFVGIACADVTDGLVAHWKFEGNANDSSGNGYNGTITQTLPSSIYNFVSGPFGGQAFESLDGCYINITGSGAQGWADFQNSSMTISIWMKSSQSTSGATLISKGSDAYKISQYSTVSAGRVKAYANGPGASAGDTGAPYIGSTCFDGQWHHIVSILNRPANTHRIYFDGQLTGTNHSLTTNSNPMATNTYDLAIGANPAEGTSLFFIGAIDDARIYNRALTGAEVEALFDPEIVINHDPNLVAWWKFDETSGTVAADSIGNMNGNIGSQNYWLDGGLYFNGADYGASKVAFNAGDTADTFSQVSDDITLAFWLKSDRENRHGNNHLFRGESIGKARLLDLEIPTGGDKTMVFRAGLNDDTVSWWDIDNPNKENYIDMSKWHYYVLTKETTTPVMKIFIDGKMVNAATRHDVNNYFFGSMAGIKFFEFAGTSANWHQFAGVVKDFRIYNKALSPQEVKRLYFLYDFADFNFDTVVDIYDLQVLAQSWLEEGQFAIADADKNNKVDLADYAYLANVIEPLNPQLHKPGWKLAFHDEFDGGDVDTTKWNIGSWSAGSYPNYFPSNDPDVYTVSNGTLKLHNVIKDYFDPGTQTTKHYGSGKLETGHKFDSAFGYFECSAKLPVGTSSFPAFWLMPTRTGGTWWPNAEVDIMEHVYDGSLGDIGANMHWNDYGDDHVSWASLFAGADTEYQFNPISTAYDDFHVYAMKWEPGVMYFYVDGYNYATFRDNDVPDSMHSDEPGSYDPDNIKTPINPGYIIINNGLAAWVPPTTQGATSTFEIDYVRVYVRDYETETTVLTYDDFESDFGNYTDGGADCSRYTGRTYAYKNKCAINIQSDSGIASSFYHTLGIDITSYDRITAAFSFYANGMSTGHKFLVEYYDGTNWNIVATYICGTDFSNKNFYTKTVTIDSDSYVFPTDMKIRFRCSAGNKNNDVYIDSITVSGEKHH